MSKPTSNHLLQTWSKTIPRPHDLKIANSDKQIAEYYEAGEPVIGITGGNVFTSLGGNTTLSYPATSTVTSCSIDIGCVTAGDSSFYFASSLLILNLFRPWASSGITNTQIVNGYRYAPNAHPGDGFMEEVESKLIMRQALIARKKIVSGDHLPHPQLRVRKGRTFTYDFFKAKRLILDSKSIGRHQGFSVEVFPHAIQVIVGFSN
ncbi:MAG: hypothetical protein CBC37_04545 [Acidimicrobiaceae bacterium TMED77]|nr:MAG: hypothetical protein CBC37_04545 [Acidimicrobiaceae bacterium TMED77]